MDMSNNKYKILLTEDEANIRNVVTTILETNGYQVLTAANCREAVLMFNSHLPDLVILDLGLPDQDGMEFIKNVRESMLTPIIVLSARADEADKVTALDYGANDYITKPFGTGELLARVRAALRNNRQHMSMEVARKKFQVRDLEIDYDKRRVSLKGMQVKFTQTEYNIVVLLAEHAGRVLTYSEIIKEIWRWSDPGSVKRLQVNMANIRKKLGTKPGEYQYISNELGVGYRMNVEE